MGIKKIVIYLTLLVIFYSCKSKKIEDFNPVLDSSGSTTGVVFGDFDSSRMTFSTTLDANNLVGGLIGKLNIKTIASLVAFKAWDSYQAVAFTEKDRHTVWMAYKVGDSWNILKLGGNPDVASDGASGTNSWYKNPIGITRSYMNAATYQAVMTSDPYRFLTTKGCEFFYIADSENRKIKLISTINYDVIGLILPLASDYVLLSERPVGLTMDASGNLYTTTKEGKILKIAAVTRTVTTVKDGLGDKLYGITIKDNTTLFFMNGKKLSKIDVNGSNYVENFVYGETNGEIPESNALKYKDVVYYNNYVYISDSTTADGTYKGSCIYKVKTDGTQSSYSTPFAGSFLQSGDGVTLDSPEDLTTDVRFKTPFGLAIDTSEGTNVKLYIADYDNSNIKMIQNMNGTPNRVEKLPIDTSDNKFMFEPRAVAISPNGENLYVATASAYMVKRVYLDGTGTVVNYTFGGAPWAIYDLKIVQEKLTIDGQVVLQDRYLFALEVNKSSWEGRVSVYDIKKGTYKILYGPNIPGLGKFTGSITLNATGTRLWVASRDLTEGKIFFMPIVYNSDGSVSIPTGYDMSDPPLWLRKANYYPSGIAYIKDTSNQAEYILVGAFTNKNGGDNILTITNFKIDRFKITEGRSDIHPIVVETIWDFAKVETLTSGYYYPRSMSVAGKYLYWIDYANAKVFSLLGTGTKEQVDIQEATIKYNGVAFKAAGIAVDAKKGKFYFASDATNTVISN